MSHDVIIVRGPDAGAYLQGQLSQDVLALGTGGSAATLLLEPSGKLGFWLTVTRTGADTFELAVDEGFGAEVVARLERFKIRTDAEVALVPGGRPDAGGAARGDEVDRITAGLPKMGAEITDGVIPAELGQAVIDASVSFTKGCYTGQELVARVDSRGGNVPRHLRGLVIDGDQPPLPGSEIVVGDKVVGTVTSSAFAPARGAAIALALVHRSVEPPAAAVVRGPSSAGAEEGPEQSAEIQALPLT